MVFMDFTDFAVRPDVCRAPRRLQTAGRTDADHGAFLRFTYVLLHFRRFLKISVIFSNFYKFSMIFMNFHRFCRAPVRPAVCRRRGARSQTTRHSYDLHSF